MKKNNLKAINEILFRALERLDDDNLMKQKGKLEIARSNAISTTSKQIISILKTKLEIVRLKDNRSKNIKDIEKSLGIEDEM